MVCQSGECVLKQINKHHIHKHHNVFTALTVHLLIRQQVCQSGECVLKQINTHRGKCVFKQTAQCSHCTNAPKQNGQRQLNTPTTKCISRRPWWKAEEDNRLVAETCSKLSLKRYWWGTRSQEVGEEGDYT